MLRSVCVIVLVEITDKTDQLSKLISLLIPTNRQLFENKYQMPIGDEILDEANEIAIAKKMQKLLFTVLDIVI